MTANTELVRAYLQAISSGPDALPAARTLLAEDLDYYDPVMQVRGADDLIAQLQNLGSAGDVRIDIHAVVGDGNVIAALTAFRLPDETSVSFAQWFWVEEGRIGKIQVIYDPGPFVDLAAS